MALPGVTDPLTGATTANREGPIRGIMSKQRPGSASTLPAWPTLDWRIDMEDRTCSIEGCNERHLCRGWCNRHYLRWKKHGDPTYEPPSFDDRFWARVKKTDTCWLWIGWTDSQGYGYFGGLDRVVAHRYVYESLVGPVPFGLELDHLCRNPSCVRPAHLEPVTHRENLIRGIRSRRGDTD